MNETDADQHDANGDDAGHGAEDTSDDAIEALWKPEGINVHFLRDLGDGSIELVHWERGAGVTQACGSGATVSATVAQRWGMASSSH